MKAFPECVPCILNQLLFVLDKCEVSKEEKNNFYYGQMKKIASLIPEKTPMEVATEMHREVRIKFNTDPYSEIKKLSGELIGENEKLLQNYFDSCNNFSELISLVISGNLIDIKTQDEVNRLDIEKILKIGLSKKAGINHSKELEEKINKAQTILYLGDNAGEIYFDKYFVKWLSDNGKKVYFAVRGDTILNDATMLEAREAGIDEVCYKLINNGYDAPGTYKNKCSRDFQKVFNKADLIISKGQGNLETLYGDKSKDIFFMLLTKCRPIAELMGTNINDIVIGYNKKITDE
ncbi:MAG: damage-control phosphatase ARMT1 family protein [Candidatus Muiribacteriota bacterium]